LLQTLPALESVIAAHSTTYLVTYSNRLAPLLAQLRPYRPSVQWQDHDLVVVLFSAAVPARQSL
jgi:hypothetical protein